MVDKFFGSKLNTFLLLILIVILLFTLRFMKNNSIVKEGVDNTDVEQSDDIVKEGIGGNKEDLVYFTIQPYEKVSGIKSYRGSVQGGYFFEGNILINVTDIDGNYLLKSNAMATTNWMTADAVEFEGNIDFTNLSKGSAYIEILEDDPSDGEGGEPGRILIPIVIE